jgi:hypothetical protein
MTLFDLYGSKTVFLLDYFIFVIGIKTVKNRKEPHQSPDFLGYWFTNLKSKIVNHKSAISIPTNHLYLNFDTEWLRQYGLK